jgi:hypothetical protein
MQQAGQPQTAAAAAEQSNVDLRIASHAPIMPQTRQK